MITLAQYWMGRNTMYASDLTDQIVANAKETVRRVNLFLNTYHAGLAQKDTVTSGWRPASVNRTTPNASTTSAHLTAEAVDLADDDGSLDSWIKLPDGRHALVACGLYAEAALYTPRWAHLQTRKTASGSRIFNPRLLP